MRLVSSAINVVCLQWTNNLARKPRKSIVAIVMMPNLHHDVMVAVKCSVLVCNILIVFNYHIYLLRIFFFQFLPNRIRFFFSFKFIVLKVSMNVNELSPIFNMYIDPIWNGDPSSISSKLFLGFVMLIIDDVICITLLS